MRYRKEEGTDSEGQFCIKRKKMQIVQATQCPKHNIQITSDYFHV